ncbi:MAG: CPBP family intramembrane glutamic endopeptidase [Cyanobacteriota bacterium]|nr:CPBP family intramembrane glutamic endopeptidase [Cyanobacteriota bacterium]
MSAVVTAWRAWPPLGQLASFLALWFLIWLPLGLPLMAKVGWNPKQDATPSQKLTLVIPLYLLAPGVVALWLWLSETSLSDYGWSAEPRFWLQGLLGWGLGLLGLALVWALDSLLGICYWQREKLGLWFKLSLPIAVLALGVGAAEELIFRGIFQTRLQSVFSPWVAAVLASAVFALLHLLWERRQTLPQIPGLFALGLVLVLARTAAQGQLGLAWGLHSAWVFGLASVDSAELLTYVKAEGTWLSGRFNQPLAGLGGVLCLALTALVLSSGGAGAFANPL